MITGIIEQKHSSHFELHMLSFVTAEEDLWMQTSHPFNEVTAVFLLNNPCYHHTSHSNEPLSYHSSAIMQQDCDYTRSYTCTLACMHACTVHKEIMQDAINTGKKKKFPDRVCFRKCLGNVLQRFPGHFLDFCEAVHVLVSAQNKGKNMNKRKL